MVEIVARRAVALVEDVDPETEAARICQCNNATLRKASRRISQLYDTVLAPIGLKTTQYSILRALDRLGPSSLNELATDLVMDRSTVGHNLRPLEREGLLELAIDPDDRRGRKVTLTKTGRARLAAGRALWVKAQERFESIYGVARAATLRDALREIASDDFADAFARSDKRR